MGELIYNQLTRAAEPGEFLGGLAKGELTELWHYVSAMGVAGGVPLEMWHLVMGEGARRFFDNEWK
jgi:hypothetical protein